MGRDIPKEFASRVLARTAKKAATEPGFREAVRRLLEAYETRCRADCSGIWPMISSEDPAVQQSDDWSRAAMTLAGDTLLAFMLLESADVVDDAMDTSDACRAVMRAMGSAESELSEISDALAEALL